MSSYKQAPDGIEWGNQQRLIGVEITLETVNGSEELMMLVPPGGKYDLPGEALSYVRKLQITLHTSNGDYSGMCDLDTRAWYQR